MINLITFLIIVFLVASVFGNHNPRHRSYPRYYRYRNYHEGSPYPDDYDHVYPPSQRPDRDYTPYRSSFLSDLVIGIFLAIIFIIVFGSMA
jgi:hypothetical protein